MARHPGLLLILLAAVAAVATTSRAQWVGGWNVIEDVAGNNQIQRVGAWAVGKHNQLGTNDRLQFVRVVAAEEQVVQGSNYLVVIDAASSRKKTRELYVAVVADLVGATTYQLSSFKPATK
uniref:Cysteine proteinase inhibitor n=1 Tax=Oryza glumipatula TaxID=40148 RepID=A0A0E0B080_9ORYZ